MRVRRHFSERFTEDYIDPTKTPRLPDQNLGRQPDEGTKPVMRSLRLKYKGSSSTGEGKRLKTKELGRKLEEGAAPSVKSLRLINKGASPGKYRKTTAPKKEPSCRPTDIYIATKLIAETALRDYNKKHGTDLELVRLLDDKIRGMWGPGYTVDFTERYTSWKHFNLEARSRNADPSDKPFLLFAEVYEKGEKYCLTTLSPVNLTDKAYGCQSCWSYINHPRHGFHTGFDTSVTPESKILSKQTADELLENALQDYNEKNGTNVKLESALECNSFTCEGLLMDLSKKKTSWVHMNFDAKVGPEEKVLRLFGELYLEDDGKYVLSTLSVAEPSDVGLWKNIFLGRECRFCPDAIRHPWRGYGFSFNYPPTILPPDIFLKARGVDFRNNFQSNPTTSKKRSRNKELGQKPEEETAQSCKKHKALGEVSIPIKWNELAESALRDYNEKHGTDLEFLRLLHKKFSYGRCYSVDFAVMFKLLKFCTFEARRRNDVPLNEPLLLLAEVYEKDKKDYLNKLSLVKLDDDDYGSLHYRDIFVRYIAYPRYGFRGGLDTSVATSEPKMLSKLDAAKLSKFALQDYNEKHGTNLKFERALKCNSFTCAGHLMDFKEKYTSWVHMNFEARVGPKEEVVCLFGELYLGNDDKYMLATLSVADMGRGGKWKTRTSESGCAFCPNDICHPPYSYLYTFSKLPSSTD